MEDRIVEEITEIIEAMVTIEVRTDQGKDHSQGIEAEVIVDQEQDLELVTNRDRIRCYNCREYYHFTRDCSTSREERDLEQLQQMLNLEAEEQTHLLTNRQSSPMENYRTSSLNL